MSSSGHYFITYMNRILKYVNYIFDARVREINCDPIRYQRSVSNNRFIVLYRNIEFLSQWNFR